MVEQFHNREISQDTFVLFYHTFPPIGMSQKPFSLSVECRQDGARLPFSRIYDVYKLVQVLLLFCSLLLKYVGSGSRTRFMQQLIRQQDVSQFGYWELRQVQRGILVRSKPTDFGQRGCMGSFCLKKKATFAAENHLRTTLLIYL